MMLQVWWTPAVPGEAFTMEVQTVEDGHRLLDILVDYTRYLEGRGLLPVYDADAGGLQAYEDGDWYDAEFVFDDSAAWEYDPRD